MTAPRATAPPRAAAARPPRAWRAAAVPAAIAALALAARLAFVAQLHATPFFSHLFSDSQLYAALARDILRGELAPRAFFMSPLYPYLFAGVQAATGDALLWMRLAQCLLGAATVYWIFRIAQRAGGRRAAVAAALPAALFPPLIFHDAAILIETWVTALAALHLLALLAAWENGRARGFAAAGLCLGAMTVFRASLGAFLLPYAAFAVLRRGAHPLRRSLAPYAAAALLCVLPWTLRNAAVEGVLAPVTASDGLNLYAGNNEHARGFYTPPPGVDLASDPEGRAVAERAAGRALTSTGVSAFWRDRAWRWMRGDPAAAAALYAKKLLLLLHPSEVEQLGVSMAFIRREYATLLDWPLPGFAVLFPFAVFGVVAGLRRRGEAVRRGGAPSREEAVRRDAALLLLLAVAAVLFATALFFANGRLRLPALPALFVFAGLGVDRLLRAVAERAPRALIAPGLAAALLTPAVYLAQPAAPSSFTEEYNRLGQIAFDAGRYAEAEGYFRRSIEQGRRSVAELNLANALAAQGRAGEADRVYGELIDREPDNHLARFNRGNLRMQRGDAPGAREDWMAALRLRPEFAPGWRNLGLLYARGGNAAAAAHYLERSLACERDPAARVATRRMLERLRGAQASNPR